MRIFIMIDEYVKLYVKRPSPLRSIHGVLTLMHEELYSEALSLLIHTVDKLNKKEYLNEILFAWQDLLELISLAHNLNNSYGKMIERETCKIFLIILDYQLPFLYLFNSVQIAKMIQNDNGDVETQLRNKIAQRLFITVQNFNHAENLAAWVRNGLNKMLEWLNDAGYIQIKN